MLMKNRLGALGFACVSLLASTGGAAGTPSTPPQSGAAKMQISRGADLKTVEGPAEYLTGRAVITGQFQRGQSPNGSPVTWMEKVTGEDYLARPSNG